VTKQRLALLVAFVPLAFPACSRDDSTGTSIVRLIDRAEDVRIESAFSAPRTMDEFHLGGDDLARGGFSDVVERFGATIEDASFAAGIVMQDATSEAAAGAQTATSPPRTLQWFAVNDATQRVRHVVVEWTRPLAPDEALFVFDVPGKIDAAELRVAGEFEKLLRTHAAFLRRLEPESRFETANVHTSVSSPDRSPTTTIVCALSTAGAPTAARAAVVRLSQERGWLLLDAADEAARSAIRNVTLGTVARDVFVLGSSGRLEIDLEIPSGDPMFRFHVGARGLDSTMRVRCALQFTTTDESVALESVARVGANRWDSVEFSLAPHAGRSGRLSLEVAPDRVKPDVILLLGEPIVEGGTRTDEPDELDVLVVSLDTTRADRMSLYGHSRKTTPNLDRLAQSSVVFDHAGSTAPWTLPSHVSFFSAQYPDRHGVIGPASHVPRDLPWLPRIARNEGYATFAVTGGGYVNSEFGFARGFESYGVSDPAYPNLEWATAKGDRAAEELARRALGEKSELLIRLAARSNRPNFAFVHTYAAHNYGAPPAALTEFGVARDAVSKLVSFDPTKRDWDLANPLDATTEQALEDARLVYDASVVTADALVGEIVAKLEATGRLDRTILVVFSDHGEELGDREGFGHGQSVFQEQIHVPLLIRVPGMAARRIADPVSLVDVAPTLCELLGWPDMDGDGRSLVPLLRGESLDPRPVLARGNRRDTVFRALRGRKEKLIETLTPGAEPKRALFELEKDNAETTDVAATRSEVRDKLATLLSRTVADQRAKGSGSGDVSISAELEAQLRQLGYLGGN